MNTPAITLPRGIRNKNPGNIRHSPAFEWKGELTPDDSGFCRFIDPTLGLRAMWIIFHHYQEFSNCLTINQLISRWAPSTENDVADYVRYVAGRCLTTPTSDFNFTANWLEFLRAVVAYENGQDPYTPDMYQSAFAQSTLR